jgi:hypothetical protein
MLQPAVSKAPSRRVSPANEALTLFEERVFEGAARLDRSD